MTKTQFRHRALTIASDDAQHAAQIHRDLRGTASIPLLGCIALGFVCGHLEPFYSLLLSIGCLPLYVVAWLYVGEAERCRSFWMDQRQQVLEQLWRVER